MARYRTHSAHTTTCTTSKWNYDKPKRWTENLLQRHRTKNIKYIIFFDFFFRFAGNRFDAHAEWGSGRESVLNCVYCVSRTHTFFALSLPFSRFSRSRYFKPTWLSLSTSSRNMICHMLSVPAFVYLLANAGHRNVDWQTSHEACRIAYIFFLLVNLKWNMRERENVEERQCWHQCESATDCDCHCIKMNL